jgi:hypothetical protein
VEVVVQRMPEIEDAFRQTVVALLGLGPVHDDLEQVALLLLGQRNRAGRSDILERLPYLPHRVQVPELSRSASRDGQGRLIVVRASGIRTWSMLRLIRREPWRWRCTGRIALLGIH